MNAYFGTKNNIGENEMDYIDYDAYASVVEKLPIDRKIRVTKFVLSFEFTSLCRLEDMLAKIFFKKFVFDIYVIILHAC